MMPCLNLQLINKQLQVSILIYLPVPIGKNKGRHLLENHTVYYISSQRCLHESGE